MYLTGFSSCLRFFPRITSYLEKIVEKRLLFHINTTKTVPA